MAKKYIDADLLREGLKELESVIHSNELVGQSMHPYDGGQLHAIKVVKELINSLQQEQPLPGTEELKEGIPGKDFIPVEWVEACEKHGIWKIVKVEQPSDDLEKKCATCAYFDAQTSRNGYCNAGAEKVVVATDTICELWKPYDMGNPEKKQILKGDRLTELDKLYKQAKRELEWFKEGKRQGKEDMLKDAVEGIVVCDETTFGYKDILMEIPDTLNVGDKVKIVIVKEEKV